MANLGVGVDVNNIKLSCLDGLRGMAAFIVVINHFAGGFFPTIKTGDPTTIKGRFDLLIFQTPLNLFFNGNLAVCIFFILSGFVLSHKFFVTGDKNIPISGAVRRYFRLLPPILGSVLLAFLLLRFGLFFNGDAAQVTGSRWLASFWLFPPDINSAIYEGLYGAFVSSQSLYNSSLWTMHTELYGSFLVFLTIALFGSVRNRGWFYLGMALFFWNSYFLAFILGIILSDIWSGSWKQRILSFLGGAWRFPVLGLGILLGTVPDVNATSTLYNYIIPQGVSPTLYVLLAHIVGGLLIVLSVLAIPILQRFFSTRPAVYLGKISFSVYVIHVIVIGSFTSYLFTILPSSIPYTLRFGIAFIPSMIIIFILADIFTKYLDQPAIRISGLIYKKWFSILQSRDSKKEQSSSTFPTLAPSKEARPVAALAFGLAIKENE